MAETLPLKRRLCHQCRAEWAENADGGCVNCGQWGMNDNGDPHIEYSFADPTDPTRQRAHPDYLGAILMTGPISGAITLRDGSVYDVTEPYIHCKPEHAGPLACVIHRIHNVHNEPGYEPHVHSDGCGSEADPAPPPRTDRRRLRRG